MKIKSLDLKKQYDYIKNEIDSSIQTVLSQGQFILGPQVEELESQLAEYVGVKHCVTVASGTHALLTAMMSLGIGHGDEVITSPFTFIAAAEMISLLGAKPVFIDIDPDSYNIDFTQIEAAITSKTKAILPINMFGQCADFDMINDIANQYAIPVIEDGAQSFGATYKGRKSCSLGTIGCTSFFPSKPFGCYGDGGACFTNDTRLANLLREIRNHGQKNRFNYQRLGLNARLDTLQAAILLAKFAIFPDELKKRIQFASFYTKYLPVSVKTPFVCPNKNSIYSQYVIQTENRDKFCRILQEQGIGAEVYYQIPLHLQPVFAHLGYQKGSMQNAEKVADRVLALPIHPYLAIEELQSIVNAIEIIEITEKMS